MVPDIEQILSQILDEMNDADGINTDFDEA